MVEKKLRQFRTNEDNTGVMQLCGEQVYLWWTESIILKSYLAWAPSRVGLKSFVTGHDDHNQRQVQCQPLSGVAGRS